MVEGFAELEWKSLVRRSWQFQRKDMQVLVCTGALKRNDALSGNRSQPWSGSSPLATWNATLGATHSWSRIWGVFGVAGWPKCYPAWSSTAPSKAGPEWFIRIATTDLLTHSCSNCKGHVLSEPSLVHWQWPSEPHKPVWTGERAEYSSLYI